MHYNKPLAILKIIFIEVYSNLVISPCNFKKLGKLL